MRTARRVRVLLALALCASLAATLCARAAAADGDLQTSTPEEQGVDSAKLVELCRFLESGPFDIRSLIVVRGGRVVFERYEQELTSEHNFYVYSVTKSFTSTLVGIAIDEKLIESVDAPVVSSFFGDARIREPDGRRSRIAVKHLLTMTSGIRWADTSKTALDADTDLARMVAAPDRLAFVLNLPMAADPGAKFNYSNGDSQLLAGIVAARSKVPVPQFARERLFEKLGFRRWEWVWPDRTGLHPGGYGLRLRARDMAKLGELFLGEGKWGGERIVSAGWVRAATRDQTRQGYGYQWWTSATPAGLPVYSAIGLKGQYVRVIPDLRLVIAMTAVLDVKTMNQTFDKIVNQFIVPAARSAGPLQPNAAAARSLEDAIARAKSIKRKLAVATEEDTPRIPDGN